MEDQRPRVSLTDAVKAVRSELLAAIVDAGSEEVRFSLGSVELEFAIDFRPAADGRVQVLVLSGGADESAQPVRIHRLRVTLDREEIAGQPVRGWRGSEAPQRGLPPPGRMSPPGVRPPPGRRPPSERRPPSGLGGDSPGDRGGRGGSPGRGGR